MDLFDGLFRALRSLLATARALSSTWSCSCFALIKVSSPKRLLEPCYQYLTKGKQVYVEGRLSSRTYQT